jgi:hypothetical protein
LQKTLRILCVLILQHVVQKGREINVETLRPTLIETWNFLIYVNYIKFVSNPTECISFPLQRQLVSADWGNNRFFYRQNFSKWNTRCVCEIRSLNFYIIWA